MRKKILFILLVLIFMFGALLTIGRAHCWSMQKKNSYNETNTGTKTDSMSLKEKTQKLVKVGNDYCPVMGMKLEKGKGTKYTYKGKIYNFCCSHCVEQFKKNPEKYIKIIAEQEKKKKNTTMPGKSN